jgi:hypothetical protein
MGLGLGSLDGRPLTESDRDLEQWSHGGPTPASEFPGGTEDNPSDEATSGTEDAPDIGSIAHNQQTEEALANTTPPPVPTAINDDAPLENESEHPNFTSIIEDIKIAREYINALKGATLDSDLSRHWLGEEIIDQIKNPPTSPLIIDDLTTRLSLDLYLAVGNASQETYNSACAAIHHHFHDEKLLSYFKVKRLVENLTGITFILEDMCINSCIGYTGPYLDWTHCPICSESRYEASLNRG